MLENSSLLAQNLRQLTKLEELNLDLRRNRSIADDLASL